VYGWVHRFAEAMDCARTTQNGLRHERASASDAHGMAEPELRQAAPPIATTTTTIIARRSPHRQRRSMTVVR
jgi:hypothetical protein